MNVKLLKNYKKYKKGDKVQVSKELGIDLIKSGIAIAHKAIYIQKEK